MELSHQSHEHSLFFFAGESDTDELVRCWGCADEICGARYSCSTCDFHLHKSCTELPPRLEDHPFHPQHPLSLLPRSPYQGVYICDACNHKYPGKNFVYHCSICEFDLDTMCALSVDLKVGIILVGDGEKELFRYGAYQHILMLEEEQSTSLGSCFVCRESMSAPFFFCSKSRCGFRLHKSCADLPQQIRINFIHDQHPLFLLSEVLRKCHICGHRLPPQHAYVCIPCDFGIHSRCTFSNSTYDINSKREKERWAAKVGEDEPPQQIQDVYFHPQHPLCLDSECSGKCKICGQESDQPTYACKTCDFFCHLRCAQLNPNNLIKKEGENQFQHSSHDHSLTLLQDIRQWRWYSEEDIPLCGLCQEDIGSFATYVCQETCDFALHDSCAQIPPQIKSHLHVGHILFSLPEPPRRKLLYCGCCGERIFGLNWHCIQCGFSLHVDCFLSLQGSEQLHDHKHWFIDSKTFNKLSCQTCGEEGHFSPWQCSFCHISVHKKCASLPTILKLVSHPHYLKLTYYLSLVHECDEMICKLCYKKVNVDYAAYYCSKCKYAAHLKCAQARYLVLEEEKQDDQHSAMESKKSITNSDITSIQEEDIKSGVILHFNHQHELTLIEQDLEDHKYCEGCVAPIFPPFYNCKQCNFYLHNRCGEAPRTTNHPFHDRLTLNVVEDLIRCDVCGFLCNGFMYQDPDCRFNLDLQCADILSEGLQHPCHEHPLFFPYKRFYEKCKGCGEDEKHILVCSECDYILGYCCLRIPHVAKHRFDNHLLKLAYINDDESGEYYCDICEEERDPKDWFYHCSQCDFFAHIGCTLGDCPHLKCGTTMKSYSHDHLLTLVEKCQRKTLPLCSSCGKHCYSRVVECCQCDLHFHMNLSCLLSY